MERNESSNRTKCKAIREMESRGDTTRPMIGLFHTFVVSFAWWMLDGEQVSHANIKATYTSKHLQRTQTKIRLHAHIWQLPDMAANSTQMITTSFELYFLICHSVRHYRTSIEPRFLVLWPSGFWPSLVALWRAEDQKLGLNGLVRNDKILYNSKPSGSRMLFRLLHCGD